MTQRCTGKGNRKTTVGQTPTEATSIPNHVTNPARELVRWVADLWRLRLALRRVLFIHIDTPVSGRVRPGRRASTECRHSGRSFYAKTCAGR